MRTPIVFTALTVTVLCLFSSGIATGQTNGSQILIARNADTIVIGEAIYLGRSPYLTQPSLALPLTNVAAVNQTVVFRVRDRIKGNDEQHLIKVSVGFSVELLTLPTLALVQERQYILLLKREKSLNACEELKVEKYEKLPCYRISREAVIVATNEEVEAIKWLVNASSRSELQRN